MRTYIIYQITIFNTWADFSNKLTIFQAFICLPLIKRNWRNDISTTRKPFIKFSSTQVTVRVVVALIAAILIIFPSSIFHTTILFLIYLFIFFWNLFPPIIVVPPFLLHIHLLLLLTVKSISYFLVKVKIYRHFS